MNDSPDIQPNSQFDQTVTFSDSSSSKGEPEQPINPGDYSPRPGMDFGNSALGVSADNDFNFGVRSNFMRIGGNEPEEDTPVAKKSGLSRFDQNFGNDELNKPSFGRNDFKNYSPRPADDDIPSSTPELAKLFSLVTSFQPPPIEITPHFKPFLPELVPAIGSIDAFIKIPRADDEVEPLGLTVLDEPTIGCSDPQILRMQLREKYGIVSTKDGDGYIGLIDDLDNNQKALDNFLVNYEALIRDRPAPSIVYSYKMPDLNDLLGEWPQELDKALESIPLPTADMELTIEEYAKIICAFLDIPVKGNIIESLHVFFTLFTMFEENQHFPINDGGSVRNSTVFHN